MIKRVYKYALTTPLRPTGENRLFMPEHWRPLHIAVQDGIICLWAEVVPDNPPETVRYRIIGTGWDIPPAADKYLGTVLAPGGFVWHVWTIAKAKPEGE